MLVALHLIGVVPLIAFVVGLNSLLRWFRGSKLNAQTVWKIGLLPFSLPSIAVVIYPSEASKLDVGYSNYFFWSSTILIFSLVFWIADFQRGSPLAKATFGLSPVRFGISTFLAFAKVLVTVALFLLLATILFHYSAERMFRSPPCNGLRCGYYEMLLGSTETISPALVGSSIFNALAFFIGVRKLLHIFIKK